MNIIEKLCRYAMISKDAATLKKNELRAYNNVQYVCTSQFLNPETSCEGNILIKRELDVAKTPIMTGKDWSRIVVSFKGSKELKDWFRDAWVWKRDWPFTAKSSDMRRVKIHAGFIDQWGSVRTKVIRELNDLIQNRMALKIKPHITFCGHSLGGALAQLAIIDCYESIDTDFFSSAYVYGNPRLYNPAGADAFNKRILFAYRTVYADDIVPQMPVLNYKHCGTPFHITNDFKIKREDFQKPFIFCKPGDHYVENYVNALRFIMQLPGFELNVDEVVSDTVYKED